MGGMGIKSIQDVDMISTARELEIISNGNSIDSDAFRTRLAAIPNYADAEVDFCTNHAWKAFKKLAGFGIYLRDKSEYIINAIFARIEQLPRYQGIGLQSVDWNIPKFRSIYTKKSPIDLRKLVQFRNEACIANFYELTSVYSCWEWVNTGEDKAIPTNKSTWTHINIPELIKNKFPRTYWQLSEDDVKKEAKKLLDINFFSSKTKHKYLKIWEQILTSLSPVFVATDGAHENGKSVDLCRQSPSNDSGNNTSAAFVHYFAGLVPCPINLVPILQMSLTGKHLHLQCRSGRYRIEYLEY